MKVTQIRFEAIDPVLLAQWKTTITQPRESGATVQSWLWAPPAKHSTRQIDQVLERIELLMSLKVDQHLGELPEAIVLRYARRLASRAPAVAARIGEPTRTIEVAWFLRYCLMISTDYLLWMVRRRVTDLWRKAADEADARRVDYARLYQQLLDELSALASDGTLSAAELQQMLNTLLTAHREHRGPNRAQIIRDQLMEEVRPVRALLKALTQQPWKASAAAMLLSTATIASAFCLLSISGASCPPQKSLLINTSSGIAFGAHCGMIEGCYRSPGF